jgi:hypothetical protein
MKKNTKSLLIVGAIIVVLFLGYFIIKWNGCIGCGQNNDFYEEQKTKQIQEQIKQQLLEDLDNGTKRLAFPATTLKLKQGKEFISVLGVNNVLPTTLSFEVLLKKEQCNNEIKLNFIYDKGPHLLSPEDKMALNFKITEDKSKSGTCLYKILIINLDTEEIYAEKNFFVQIT